MEKGQTIEVLYLTAGRMYFRQKGRITRDWPSWLLNHRGEMAHNLKSNPIFPKIPAGKVDTWGELLALQPAQEPATITTWQILCEDNSAYPLSTQGYPTVPELLRDRQDRFEETVQKANTSATQEALGGPVATTTAVIAAVAASAFVLMMDQREHLNRNLRF